MALTILLAKVFGLYLMIGGAATAINRKHYIPIVAHFPKEGMMRLILSILELTGGLFLVISHNVWNSWASGLVSLFGWMLLVEGVFYMVASDKIVAKLVKHFNRPRWYLIAGAVSVVMGGYLVGFGYSWF